MLKITNGGGREPKSLANRVAQQLAQVVLPATSQELGGLQVSVIAPQGDDDNSLARLIVTQILQQLDTAS